jgi:hypothetical protein
MTSRKEINSTLAKRYADALNRIPSPGGGCHVALLGVANLGRLTGLSEADIFSGIRAAIPQGQRRIPDKEIRDAIAKAFRDCEPLTEGAASERPATRKQVPTTPPFDGPKYRQALIREGDGAGEVDLWELSPYRIDWEPGAEDALAVLRVLYEPNEFLFLGDTYGAGDCVRPVADHLRRIEAGEPLPPHVIPNPLDGDEHAMADGKTSRRCDSAVADFRFALVEFDTMPRAEQFAFWFSVLSKNLLPVAALVDSGNKSVHAWLRVSLPDAAAWDRDIRRGLYDPKVGRMTLLGADRANQNPSRLSRLPGHLRADKGRVQK